MIASVVVFTPTNAIIVLNGNASCSTESPPGSDIVTKTIRCLNTLSNKRLSNIVDICNCYKAFVLPIPITLHRRLEKRPDHVLDELVKSTILNP